MPDKAKVKKICEDPLNPLELTHSPRDVAGSLSENDKLRVRGSHRLKSNRVFKIQGTAMAENLPDDPFYLAFQWIIDQRACFLFFVQHQFVQDLVGGKADLSPCLVFAF